MNIFNKIATFFLLLFTLGTITGFLGQTVTDVDGNIYNTVIIGDQHWLKENMNVVHYPDGATIPDVKVYNNSAANADTYGRLYTWEAAMNGSALEKVQGICPNGWHIPSEAEWTKLATHLGGFPLAGGKLKEAGTAHWNSPNSGATNLSDFTALPAGEHDTEKFQLLNEYAVIWSSTESSQTRAIYYYLAYNDQELHPFDYYKSFYYSVRCIKDQTTSVPERQYHGLLIYPNPFDHMIHFEQTGKSDQAATTTTSIYDAKGQQVAEFNLESENCEQDLHHLSSGVYYIKTECDGEQQFQKVIKK